MAIKELKAMKDIWAGFVGTLGITDTQKVEELANALFPLLGDIDDNSVAMLQNPEDTPDAEIKSAIASFRIPTALVNKAIRGVRKVEVKEPAPPIVPSAATIVPAAPTLPPVPRGLTLLRALKTGGLLHFKPETLVGAMGSLLVDSLGLSDIEERLRDAIEKRYDITLKRPVPPIYLQIDALAKSREYAEMLEVLRVELGVADRRRYISASQREKLHASIAPIFRELKAIQDTLQGYFDKMGGGGASQALMQQAMQNFVLGLPPNPALAALIKPQPPTAVVAAVEGMIERANKMLAGTRSITAAALLPEAASWSALLENEDLYAAMGVEDKEQMLTELGISADADLILAEENVAAFMLAVFEIPKTPPANLPMYIASLAMVGIDIPWDRLDTLVQNRSTPRRPVAPSTKEERAFRDGIPDNPRSGGNRTH